MSRLYPTLEDLKVDEITQAQIRASGGKAECTVSSFGAKSASSLYPCLSEYLGLDLNEVSNALVSAHGDTSLVAAHSTWESGQVDLLGNRIVAPVTDNDKGIVAAAIKPGLRSIVLCKDNNGITGLSVQAINNGIFVSFVQRDSAAALGGLRFADQILQINDESVAGWSTDKTLKFLKKADGSRISMVVRDRPLERTVTMNKDSSGLIGFEFKNNKITKIVQDSSAARNGILTNHHLTEINGQNVIGMKDQEVSEIIAALPSTVTVTIIPSTVYDAIIRKIDPSTIKKSMDHSVPSV